MIWRADSIRQYAAPSPGRSALGWMSSAAFLSNLYSTRHALSRVRAAWTTRACSSQMVISRSLLYMLSARSLSNWLPTPRTLMKSVLKKLRCRRPGSCSDTSVMEPL